MIHKDHALGDDVLNKANNNEIADGILNRHDFRPKRYNKAIGGAQIVKGDFARSHGYLPNTKWMRPINIPFCNTREDVAIRNYCQQHGDIIGVDLPGVYRVRHSTTPHS